MNFFYVSAFDSSSRRRRFGFIGQVRASTDGVHVSSHKVHTEQKFILRSSKQIVLAKLSRKVLPELALQIPVGGIGMAGHSGRCNVM